MKVEGACEGVWGAEGMKTKTKTNNDCACKGKKRIGHCVKRKEKQWKEKEACPEWGKKSINEWLEISSKKKKANTPSIFEPQILNTYVR